MDDLEDVAPELLPEKRIQIVREWELLSGTRLEELSLNIVAVPDEIDMDLQQAFDSHEAMHRLKGYQCDCPTVPVGEFDAPPPPRLYGAPPWPVIPGYLQIDGDEELYTIPVASIEFVGHRMRVRDLEEGDLAEVRAYRRRRAETAEMTDRFRVVLDDFYRRPRPEDE